MARFEGVYQDGRGGWYFKVSLGQDALTRRRTQLTRRGFATAAAAARARRDLLAQLDRGQLSATPASITVNDLLNLYLEGAAIDRRLSPKTIFDYTNYTDSYIRPLLGDKKAREVTPAMVLAWQRKLATGGGVKDGKALKPNTIRLARSPLSGAFKMALSAGLVSSNPAAAVPRPRQARSVPRHWSPEQARVFLRNMEGERTYPLWAFLLGSGVRIGELVWLRWENVDLKAKLVRIVEFAATLGYELRPSGGKSRDAVRTIDLDDGLVRVLRIQRKLQAEERLAADAYLETDYVFTRELGGAYHPQVLSKQLGVISSGLQLPRLTAHGLRHTSATLMLASGVPAKVAAERLGHADATLFMNLYSHVTPTMQREAADKIGAALFGTGEHDD